MGNRGDPGSGSLRSGQLFNQLRVVLLFQTVNFLVVFVHLRRIVHRAELWPTHRAERSFLVVIVGKRLVVHSTRSFGIERERELLFPIEFVSRKADGVVTVLCTGTLAAQIRRMRGNLVSDDSILDVVFVGKPEMLFGSDVAKH